MVQLKHSSNNLELIFRADNLVCIVSIVGDQNRLHTPIEILTQLRAMHFDAGTFDGTEGYIRYMQNTIRRMTEQPCELPESSTEERAAALIHVLQEIGALELLEE